jgi:hypothetical protein
MLQQILWKKHTRKNLNYSDAGLIFKKIFFIKKDAFVKKSFLGGFVNS